MLYLLLPCHVLPLVFRRVLVPRAERFYGKFLVGLEKCGLTNEASTIPKQAESAVTTMHSQ